MQNSNITGTSDIFLKVLAAARQAAGSRARVLLTGETGTGKEKLSRYIHDESPRRDNPFVAVNCAALSPELLESELFGHVKGAFTTALRAHDGLVAAATGGTLFLDEIAELAPPLQARLLRFIDTGEFRKVGSTREERADARIIAATHRDLARRAATGLFREDLYYRLAVLRIALPPLRARKGDIPALAQALLGDIARAENREAPGLDDGALAELCRRDWPGNIRELQNTLHQAAVMNPGTVLTAEMLPPPLSSAVPNHAASPAVRPLRLLEQEAIDAALTHCNGNIPKAAALLEVSPSTLYRRREGVEDGANN